MLAAAKMELQVSKKIPCIRKNYYHLNPKPLTVPIFVLLSLLSEFVEIVVSSGETYQGFLHCNITKTNMYIILYKAQCISCNTVSDPTHLQTLTFLPKNIISVYISRYKKISFPGYVTDFLNTSLPFQYVSSDNKNEENYHSSRKVLVKNSYLTFSTLSLTPQPNKAVTISVRARSSRVTDALHNPILSSESVLDSNGHVVNNIERKIHSFKFNLDAPAFKPKVTRVSTSSSESAKPNPPSLLDQATIDHFIALRRKNASNVKNYKQFSGQFYLLDSVYVPPHL